MKLVGFYIMKGEALCVNIKDVSSAEAQMRGKKKSRRPAPACQNCSMCSITVFSSFIAKTAGIRNCTTNNLQPPETFSTCSLEDDGSKGETVMGEKYGSLIAIFILALCVHSNIVVEHALLQTIIKAVSLFVMIASALAAFVKGIRQPS